MFVYNFLAGNFRVCIDYMSSDLAIQSMFFEVNALSEYVFTNYFMIIKFDV